MLFLHDIEAYSNPVIRSFLLLLFVVVVVCWVGDLSCTTVTSSRICEARVLVKYVVQLPPSGASLPTIGAAGALLHHVRARNCVNRQVLLTGIQATRISIGWFTLQ